MCVRVCVRVCVCVCVCVCVLLIAISIHLAYRKIDLSNGLLSYKYYGQNCTTLGSALLSLCESVHLSVLTNRPSLATLKFLKF